jgi:hypothetical protein
MRDPHVEKLLYEVHGEGPVSYKDPEPLSFSNQLGEFAVVSGVLSFEPVEHFATEEAAKAAVDPFLRSWEIGTDLTLNVGEIRFKYSRAEMIDRDPPPPGSPQTLTVKSASSVFVGSSASIAITRHNYPPPPSAFRSTPEVEMAYRRWIAYRNGREPLQSMAYFVLTLLHKQAGGRKQAAATFSISRNVLQTHGRLCSRGGADSARKVKTGMPLEELSESERSWLAASAKLLVRRLGEHASGAPVSQITMRDLPPLKN